MGSAYLGILGSGYGLLSSRARTLQFPNEFVHAGFLTTVEGHDEQDFKECP